MKNAKKYRRKQESLKKFRKKKKQKKVEKNLDELGQKKGKY